MRIARRRELHHDDGPSVAITIAIQSRTFRPPVYHVVVEDSHNDEWDVHVQYVQGTELKWAHNRPWRTETPEPAKLTLDRYRDTIREYERMGYY